MGDSCDKREVKRFVPPPWEESRSSEAEQISNPPRAELKTPQKTGERRLSSTAELDAMLSQLSLEEAKPNNDLWKVGLLAALILVSIGVMMLIWGGVSAARTASAGVAGLTGSLILVVFGMFFIGLAMWTAMRHLKRRGD